MNTELIKKNYHISTFILLYFSLILGFFLGENTTLGPKFDFNHALKQVELFERDFLYTFFNYDEIKSPTRISPVFILIIYSLKKIVLDAEIVRFILLNIIILNQIFFYKCLKICFSKKLFIDKKILFLLSCVLFLSPSFRSNAIWPESAMLGLLFFNISLYYFLKFNENIDKISFLYLNIFFLSLSAYIRPSFAIFVIFFFIYSYLRLENKTKIFNIVILNCLLAFPAFYYLFFLEIFFLSSGVGGDKLDLNYFSKLPIILSIIIFHLIPILYYKNFFVSNPLSKINLNIFFITFLISTFSILYFNYDINFTGGGILLHLSNFLFLNNVLFLILIPIIIFISLKFIEIDLKKNSLIFLILILMVPQFSVYHKYYDPLVLVLIFSIFNFRINKDFFSKKYMVFLYMFYLTYYVITVVNSYYIKF